MEIVASQTNHLVPGAHFVPDSHHHYHHHHHHHLNLILSLLVLCSIWSRALAVTTTQQHNREQVTNFGHPSETDDDGSSKLATMFGEPHHHEDASAESNAGWMRGNSAGHDHDHDVIGELGTDNQQPDRTLLSNENEMYNHHGNFSSENDEPSESRSRKRLPNIQTQAPTMDGGGGTVWKEFLTSSLAEEACKLDRGCQRRDRLNDTYLNYCNRYKLENLFSSQILMSIMHDTTKRCQTILAEFIQLDDLINHFYGLFEKLLTRYNCHNGYSVKWTCEDCKKAYQDWLCATSLPYYMNGYNIKPCISFCERVEQRCPYLHPTVKEQYGGQPVFICRDPNIPFVKAITHDIPYEEPSKCYDLCHLSQNRTELFIDSLSKYDPEMCPEPNLLAEKVRNESVYCQMPSGENLGASNQDDSVNVSGGEVDADVGSVASNGSLSSNRPTSVHIHVKKFAELKDVLEVHLAQQKLAKNNIQKHSNHR